MAANLFKLKMKQSPNAVLDSVAPSSPVTLSDTTPEVQTSPTPVVSQPPRVEASTKPAVFDASHVPFAQLSMAPSEKSTHSPMEETADKEPVRLILDVNVPPGCRPMVLVLDGPNQPTCYHQPTKNNYGAVAPSESDKPVIAHLNYAPSWPEGW